MKKRYYLTLTIERVERFQKSAKAAGLHPSFLSETVDDYLDEMSGIIEMATKKGKITVLDVFTEIGKQMEKYNEDETKTVGEAKAEI
jgi:hypothetical protein